MSPEDFLKIAMASKCIVGNSSVAIRECSYLGIPAVNIGTRQRNRERGINVIDTIHDENEILQSINSQLTKGHLTKDTLYGDGQAGEKMAEILATAELTIEKTLML